MDITSLPFTERPVRILEVRFISGTVDSVTLEATDTYTVGPEGLCVELFPAPTHPTRETVLYRLAHIAMWRLLTTTAKTPVAAPAPHAPPA